MEPVELSDLLDRARHGDGSAWAGIVDEYSGLLLSVVRGFRLGDAQSADVVQTTWLRLVEHIDQVRDPARLCGWLRTTAFRSCLEVLRENKRELPVDPYEQSGGTPDRYGDRDAGRPDEGLLRSEREVLVRRALADLPERHQVLLGLLVQTPALSYEEISRRLAMPIGSIGPTRARVLRRLRSALAASDFSDCALG
jgi:RNA polymerase sigma factor (sigma-70 family)